MTEVPEHLLARSRARRSGGAATPAAESPADTPASTTASAAPAASATPAAPAPAPKKEEPKLPWVEAANARPKMPVWAVAGLVLLPIWALSYAFTNDPPSPKTAGPLTTGATVFGSSCAACHGATGGGGVGPQLSAGAVLREFPKVEDQLRWVMLGTAGFKAEGTKTFGASKKSVDAGGVMPSQIALPSDELLAVVRHERDTLSAEKYDKAAWDAAAEALVNDKNSAVSTKAKEFKAIIDAWTE
ncbi:MAG: hypothetical protein R2698_05625 [Microthrixaceae bacterium]